jgi:hypothetical protein
MWKVLHYLGFLTSRCNIPCRYHLQWNLHNNLQAVLVLVLGLAPVLPMELALVPVMALDLVLDLVLVLVPVMALDLVLVMALDLVLVMALGLVLDLVLVMAPDLVLVVDHILHQYSHNHKTPVQYFRWSSLHTGMLRLHFHRNKSFQ